MARGFITIGKLGGALPIGGGGGSILWHQGPYDPGTDTPNIVANPSQVKEGYLYTISAAGTFYGEAVDEGDIIIATADGAAALGDWSINEMNITVATETTPGYISLATTAEIDTGTVPNKAITPAALAASVYSLWSSSNTIWIGSTGDNTRDGLSDRNAVSSFTTALTKAQALGPTAGNQVSINSRDISALMIDDDGSQTDDEYDISRFLNVYVPDSSITFTGGIAVLYGNQSIIADKIDTGVGPSDRVQFAIADNNGRIFIKANTLQTETDEIIKAYTTSANNPDVYLEIDKINITDMVSDGFTWPFPSNLHINAKEIIVNNTDVIGTWSVFNNTGSGNIYISSDNIEALATGGGNPITLAKITGTGSIYLKSKNITCNKLYDITNASATFIYGYHEYSETIAGTAVGGSTIDREALLSDVTGAGGGDLLSTNNLSDVANQQTSLNNVTNVIVATNEYVLTKDTATGDAIWKPSPSTSIGNYTHTQAIASTTWSITHNLGRYVSATAYDGAGSEIIGQLTRIDGNTITLVFNTAQSGTAYIV